MPLLSLGAKVPKRRGDFFRKKLTELKLIDNKLIINDNDRFLYIPLATQPPEQLLNDFPELEIVDCEFNNYPNRERDYRDHLKVPLELMEYLPTSYDIIGSIAILKLKEPVISVRNIIGQAIISSQKNIKTVALDKGVKGALRVRDLEIIAGENKTETIHKEYNIKLNLDVAKVYFSPRLSAEHYRISQLVEPGEMVLDMFAGVGPFSIMIAKFSKAERVYSIDLNKIAIKYLIQNIDQNKITNIFPLEGDVRLMIRKIPKVDRIIMNLPLGAWEYLQEAFAVLKNKGVIHYHEMLDLDDLQARKDSLIEKANQNKYEVQTIVEYDLGSYSPTINHYCFDLTLKRYKET
jgi:tRNA (guanine37-N1)-methyltransferase